MRIFELRLAPDEFQKLLCDDPTRAGGLDLIFDCDQRTTTWNPPEVYISNPRAKRGSFFSLGSWGFFVCTQELHDELEYLFAPCAEMLPLPFEDETLWIVNVLTCLNLLDEKRSEFNGAFPKRYVFHAHRMQPAPLFKVPRTSRGQILTSQGYVDENYDFKLQVERRGFEGLKFKELWSNDNVAPCSS